MPISLGKNYMTVSFENIQPDTTGADRNRYVGRQTSYGQQNKTKDKHRTHETTLKTKAGITRTLQKPG